MRGVFVVHSLCALAACFCLPLAAKDLAAYRVGDVAETDIIAPIALEVPDAAATAELKAARARQFPSIFRSYPAATNQMAQDFFAGFDQARTSFLAEMSNEFQVQPLAEAAVKSGDFGRLVTAFGVTHKDFPVTDELAAEWARGKDGHIVRDELLTVLLWASNRQVRPDTLPGGMDIGQTVRLVPVAEPDQKLSFEAAQQGPLVPAAGIITVSNAQALFRREFPAGQQLFARALAGLIRPNCLPDAPLTRLTRGTAVYQMVVSDHFDAGDAIVRQGDKIDDKTAAALEALSAALKSKPPAEPVAAANARPQAQAAPQPSPPPSPPASAPAHAAAAPVAITAVSEANLRPGLRHMGLIFTLAGISFGALLVAWWQFLKERKRAANSSPVAQPPLPLPGTIKADLTPQVAQAVREAVQQELASQRRELLMAQQAAADEIAALVRRLDELQAPMQQRLQTYENRIQSLEKELAVRNEENRELLKLKIEMISRQLAAERANSVTTITAS